MGRRTHHVYLVPGFFGFANLGEFYYFSHLHDQLDEMLDAAGIDARVHRVKTHPTASVRRRAQRLLEEILETSPEDAPIHLVCHSTGGLDARLMLTPGTDLSGTDPEPVARRVRTCITLACPHRGTPLASFFASRLGADLLRLLSLGTVYVLRYGRLPLRFLFRLVGLVTRLDDAIGWRHTFIDQLFSQLLTDFSPERREAVRRFFEDVGAEQALILQLTPESMELFCASCRDRPEVAYASVVTKAHPPGLKLFLTLNPYAEAMRIIYAVLHSRTARLPGASAPTPSKEHADALLRAYGRLPRETDNDGVVPTLSQPWGEVLAAVEADHLDVIGHFDDREHNPPHIDWLPTLSDFDRRRFVDVCGRIVRFIETHR